MENSEAAPAKHPEVVLQMVDLAKLDLSKPDTQLKEEVDERSMAIISNFTLGPVILSPMSAPTDLSDIGPEENEQLLAKVIREQAFVPMDYVRGGLNTPFTVGFVMEGGKYFWLTSSMPIMPFVPLKFPSQYAISIEVHTEDEGEVRLNKEPLMLDLQSPEKVVLTREWKGLNVLAK